MYSDRENHKTLGTVNVYQLTWNAGYALGTMIMFPPLTVDDTGFYIVFLAVIFNQSFEIFADFKESLDAF